jgi:hypothetical protein
MFGWILKTSWDIRRVLEFYGRKKAADRRDG